LSSPFFGDAQSCKEALSSFNVGDEGLSGGLLGAGGGQACLGDCILRGAGAAGVTPRVDGVRVELPRRAGGSVFCVPAARGERFLLLGSPSGGKPGGPDAPRARSAGRAEASG